MDNLSKLTLYGVPILVISHTVVGIIEYYKPMISSKMKNTVLGILCIIGFVVSSYLPSLEIWLPWISEAIPTLLMSIIIFGTMIGATNILRNNISHKLFMWRNK